MIQSKSYQLSYRGTHNISETPEKYGLLCKLVRSWMKNKNKILVQNKKSFVRCVSPSESRLREYEKLNYNRIKLMREEGKLIAGNEIIIKAFQLNSHGAEFNRSSC